MMLVLRMLKQHPKIPCRYIVLFWARLSSGENWSRMALQMTGGHGNVVLAPSTKDGPTGMASKHLPRPWMAGLSPRCGVAGEEAMCCWCCWDPHSQAASPLELRMDTGLPWCAASFTSFVPSYTSLKFGYLSHDQFGISDIKWSSWWPSTLPTPWHCPQAVEVIASQWWEDSDGHNRRGLSMWHLPDDWDVSSRCVIPPRIIYFVETQRCWLVDAGPCFCVLLMPSIPDLYSVLLSMTSVWNIESFEVNPGNPTGVILPKDLSGNTVVDLVGWMWMDLWQTQYIQYIMINPNWGIVDYDLFWYIFGHDRVYHIHWKPHILLLSVFPGLPTPEAWTIFCRMPAAPSMAGGWQHLRTLHLWGGLDPAALKISFSDLFRTIKTTFFPWPAGRARSPTVASVVTTWWTFSPSAKPSAWWAGE